jgi:hypothetical protein
VGSDVGVTKEKGLISGTERQVNKETERSDIGGTQGEGLVCGIEKQVIFHILFRNIAFIYLIFLSNAFARNCN